MKNNLRVLLAERKLKVSDLHDLTGISTSTLTDFYYERANPNARTLLTIAKALKVSLDELIEVESVEL